MDILSYSYDNGNNQLTLVEDAVDSNVSKSDIDNQLEVATSYNADDASTHNYVYDEIGQLIEDKAEGINNIEWTISGKVSKIEKDDKTISFAYDGLGNRISKTVEDSENNTNKTTYYARDAQGNVLGVYELDNNTKKLNLEEQHIYGSSRLGLVNNEIVFDGLTDELLVDDLYFCLLYTSPSPRDA